VMVAPSAKISDERIRIIEDVISKGIPVSAEEPTQPTPEAPHEPDTRPEPASATEPPQPEPADEQRAVIEVTHDMAVLEAAQDLVIDILGIDLDELKRIAPLIDKLIHASSLGLPCSLHIESGDVILL